MTQLGGLIPFVNFLPGPFKQLDSIADSISDSFAKELKNEDLSKLN